MSAGECAPSVAICDVCHRHNTWRGMIISEVSDITWETPFEKSFLNSLAVCRQRTWQFVGDQSCQN
jgi:hypothetical protein